MAYTSGTATDQNNLLAALRTWLTGLGSPWTSLAYSAGATPADASTLYLQGPGAGSGKRVHVNIRTAYNAMIPAWSWEIRAATDYDGAKTFDEQPNVSPSVWLNLNANSQDYWLFANDRRFVVVSAVDAANYCSAYAGMFLPYATPAEYPQPLYVGAAYSAQAAASLNNAANRFIVDPGYGAAYYLRRSPLAWKSVFNNRDATGVDISWQGTEGCIMWPHRSRRAAISSLSMDANDWNRAGWDSLRPNAAGERMLFQANIIDTDDAVAAGALDGCYSVPGFGLTTTQLITIGGRNFRAFQNINRSGRRDFMAVEQV